MALFATKIRRVKFWWRLSFAYIQRYQVRVVSILVSLFISILIGARFWPAVSRTNVVTIGYVGQYTIENIPTEVLSLATQSLISEDSQGKPIPSLASHWTVSDDGKKYIVFLKDNLSWHDSTPIDAKDISIAITNVKITALNNKTIEFMLPNPIASFPQALNKPVFKAKTFYGTGEFRIVAIDQVEGIVKRIALHPKDSGLPRVEIKFYQTEEQAQNALKIAEIKTASVANAKLFEDWPNLSVDKKTGFSETVAIFFDTEDDILSSKELRQALTYAINRSKFDGENAYSPISAQSWAYNNSIKRYDYNTGKARELLSKANPKSKSITLSYMQGMQKIAQQIKDDWEAIGLKVTLKEEKAVPSKSQALLALNKLTPDPDQYAMWHSTQKETNITNYKNVKIDKLLEDARATQDQEKRKDYYFDFQKFLLEDAPAAFLYYPYKYKVTYNNVRSLIDKLPK